MVKNKLVTKLGTITNKMHIGLPGLNKKNRIVLITILAFIVTFLLGVSYGMNRKESNISNYPTSNAKNWTIVGKITEVSDSKIKVKDSRSQEKEAEVTKYTKIVNRKGNDMSVNDLKKEQKAVVIGEKDGNTLKATRIRVQS